MPYVGSYIWKMRQKYGSDLLLLPAASVIVEREDGAILLMKRADNGEWSIIGGYAEEGAGFRETAITELREEAAIEADKADLIPFAALSNPKTNSVVYPNGDKVQVFAHCFIIRKWRQLQSAPDEHEVLDLAFFQPDSLPENLSQVTLEEIAAYKKYRATGEFQSC